ncbi:nucleotide sugar dehydrogenase [Mariniflexile litorale]|uniref:Nucleotide sugar dehydrogenase n=1 Tax=Mariniflexile litorale TaxID=3045158 RepID=A0AAU7EF86_9FLAO|nr:nucleotide sugar dehydrogenase [Mariniflexile sp. KMM 9835]MDQ8211494.1 nucleotide sugar dehydrogenase [Mariniflexile sp. KMM 9835]
MSQNEKIAVIGLGYVGLPLARLFATKYPVLGFDINPNRVDQLQIGKDATLEIEEKILKAVLKQENDAQIGLYCSSNQEDLKDCNVYIVTVPTPIDKNNRPNMQALYMASKMIGSVITKGNMVVFESTVYPGATEEDCIPIIEKASGLVYNKDFFAGYSPERINPGDKEHTVDTILKITSGSTPEIANKIDKLYSSVITAGTYKAPSIKVAEAAKVIENSQRDINIAFVNELAKIFNLMDLDTHAVLEAAGTKWNFLPFKPGLVGGHCIGVDPYYLAQKAQELGYHPEIILAGRRVNDSMGQYVAMQVIKLMLQKDIKIKGANILILGITFKENCPDVRNTRVIDIIEELQGFGVNLTMVDPWANPEEVKHAYGLTTTTHLPLLNRSGSVEEQEYKFDAVVLAVAHQEFLKLNLKTLLNTNGVLYDVKGFIKEKVDGKL